MICDFVDNLATCHAINAPSFPIDYRRTCNTVPKPYAGANLVQHPILRELDDYERWRNGQLDQHEVVHLPRKKQVTFSASIDVGQFNLLDDDKSDTSSRGYTNVQRLDRTM